MPPLRRGVEGTALLLLRPTRHATTCSHPFSSLRRAFHVPFPLLLSSLIASSAASPLPRPAPIITAQVALTSQRSWNVAALLSSLVAALLACYWSASPAVLCDEGRAEEQRIEGFPAPPSPVPVTDDGLRLLVRQGRAELSLPDAALSAEEWAYLQRYVDDCVVYRYLVAHSFHLDRALRAIRTTVRWRVGQSIDAINPHTNAKLKAKILDHSMWVSRGVACDGSPVVINRKSQLPELDHSAQFELIVYTLERAIRAHSTTPPSPSAALPSQCRCQWVWWLDMAHFNSSSSTPLSEAQRVVDVLMSHYVERLSVAIVLDAPVYFSFIFRAVSVFLPAKTKSKVVFVRNMEKDSTRAIVARYIALEQLEQPYGLLAPITMADYIDEDLPRTPHINTSTA